MNVHATPEPVTTLDWNDQTYRILLTQNESNGRIGIFESICPLNGGPPRHLHQKEDETFYVLRGEMVFWLDGATITKGPGEVFLAPRGKEHTFTVAGSEPARFLVHLTPGGFEGFFQSAAARNLRIPEDLDAITKLAADYSMIITGPPLRA
ncbi:MAG: cupin domain-containing protein [Bauldia sp.]